MHPGRWVEINESGEVVQATVRGGSSRLGHHIDTLTLSLRLSASSLICNPQYVLRKQLGGGREHIPCAEGCR